MKDEILRIWNEIEEGVGLKVEGLGLRVEGRRVED